MPEGSRMGVAKGGPPLRIAYVVRHIDSAGGRERVLTNKANYIVRNFGYEVFIVTLLQTREQTVFDLDDRVQMHHLKLRSREAFSGGRIAYARYVRGSLESILRKVSPHITISMWWGAEFRALPALKDGSRKILEFHSSQYMRSYAHRASVLSMAGRFRWAITRWLEDRVVDRYDRFVVLTQEDRRSWQKANVVVIPNSVSFVSEAASDCTNPVVVSVGRLTESKGFDRLIDIWAALETDYPDWSLQIFGDGEERESLSRMIAERGLTRVSLRPATSNIEAELLQASVFAFTSRYEGFGMVLIEAMQCGLPVVSYRTKCGPAEIVDDNVTGFLVEEGDSAAFEQRLRCLIEDWSLRRTMGAAAKRVCSARFGEQVVMERWKDLFEDLALEVGR